MPHSTMFHTKLHLDYAEGILELRGGDFEQYHGTRLNELPWPLDRLRLMKLLLRRIGNRVFNPKRTLEVVWRRLERAPSDTQAVL